ncbi:MAG: hypothetical protein IJP01_04605 [Oscillospiraceae bacterium]|nr:hypothetical protein [Oscillospiraceae bacterium]
MENMDFESMQAALAQSWEVHRQAFGPILEPMFEEMPQLRVVLVNALNYISRREVERGMELLKQLQPHCTADADKAGYAFFVGLCFEMGGAAKQSRDWYEKANAIGHSFYLPYLKLAKAAHGKGELEQAKALYGQAIRCLNEAPLGVQNALAQDEVLLGAAYTNLTSCLTMLHRLDEAQAAWKQAEKYPLQPAAYATAAILCAALKDRERCDEYLEKLGQRMPALLPQTRRTAYQILSNLHPAFMEFDE